MPRKPKIESITRQFNKAHQRVEKYEKEKGRLRAIFFNLISFDSEQLARQTIYVEGDPDQHVATLYPKWRVVTKELIHLDDETEWRVIIEEDPEKKNFTFVNALDGMAYTRTVAESAPGIDLDRLKAEKPLVYQSVTFQPDPPPRELKALKDLTEEQKDIVKTYLTPAKLTNRMEKPRKAKPEELEGLPDRTRKG